MRYQWIPYAYVLFSSAIVSLFMAVLAWSRRTVPAAKPFIVLMATSVVWSVSNAFEMMGLDLGTKLFWANVQYICYNIIPVTWLVMALEYTGKRRWLTPRRLILLLAIPVVTVILVWTNPSHGLMRRNIFLDTSGAFPTVGKTYGPWFWVFAAYTYPLMIVAAVVHVRSILRMPSVYRWQTVFLLTGLILPLVVNLAYTFKLTPFKHDIAPAMFSAGGILYAFGLFRFGLFEIVPAGYDLVIKSMGDGMIMFDRQNRIVDFNPAAARITGLTAEMIGRPVSKALSDCLNLDQLLTEERGYTELTIKNLDKTGYYEANWWPIIDDRGRLSGRMLLLHDITEAREARQQALHHQRLTAILQERERLGRELHDSLGQVFGYVNVQAQAVRKLISAGEVDQSCEYLEKMIRAAREAHSEVREFIQSAMSSVLSDRGLFAAIPELLKKLQDSYGVETRFEDRRMALSRSLNPDAEAQILRIVQESLNNVRKHSKARSVSVEVEDSEEEVTLVIQDDGVGFDPSKIDGSDSFGLRIMKERAAEAGGRLDIVSEPGLGTRVCVQVPYAQERTGGLGGDDRAGGAGGGAGERVRASGQAGAGGQTGAGERAGVGEQARAGGQTRAGDGLGAAHRAGTGDRAGARSPVPAGDQAQAAFGMRVLLVDDHPLFLNGLVGLLSAHGIEVVGTARDGFEALQQAQRLKPSVIVMDIEMPRCDGLTATRLIKAKLPDVKILMLTVSETDETLFQAVKNGASGYLLKDLDGEEFVNMLMGLERGETPLSPAIANRFLSEFMSAEAESAAASSERQLVVKELTPNQLQILTMVAKGMTYKQIGEVLSLSERTIKYHMGEVVEKLHVENRRQAIDLARRAGL